MTITVTNEEVNTFESNLDKWRHGRDLAFERAMTKSGAAQDKIESIFGEIKQWSEDNPMPTLLNGCNSHLFYK